MKRLSETEYKATMGEPMTRRESNGSAPFDFWSYFDRLPTDEFFGHDFSDCVVDYVYADPSGLYEHVLVNSLDENVFLVLVLDLKTSSVLGHRVLDLRREYGLAT